MSAGGPFGGGRVTPAFEPAPNSQPLGARTGAPPRPRFYRRDISSSPEEIVEGTPENRVVTLTAPDVGYTIYIGDSGLNANNGMALSAGVPTPFQLVGLQKLLAVTDAPVPITLSIVVAPILMAERQRLTE